MASLESIQIRRTFSKSTEPITTPIEAQRQEWEDAVAQAPLPSGTAIEPVEIGGVACEWVRCGTVDGRGMLLHIHGGGFSAGSCRTHRELAARLSLAAGVPVLLMDYRLAPEHPFPAGLEDVIAVYRDLAHTGAATNSIVMSGDSAGGGLALSALVALRDAGDWLPAATVLISPWLDLLQSGESMVSRADIDPLGTRAGFENAVRLYIGDRDPREPLISPLNADLHGLPPLLVQVGDHELLLDDAVRLAERATAVGVETTLEIWPEMWHVWHGWAASLPEGQEALDRIGRFVHEQVLNAPQEQVNGQHTTR